MTQSIGVLELLRALGFARRRLDAPYTAQFDEPEHEYQSQNGQSLDQAEMIRTHF